MVDNGIISHIATHLVFAVDKLNVTCEVAWLTTYLAARSVLWCHCVSYHITHWSAMLYHIFISFIQLSGLKAMTV